MNIKADKELANCMIRLAKIKEARLKEKARLQPALQSECFQGEMNEFTGILNTGIIVCIILIGLILLPVLPPLGIITLMILLSELCI